MWIAAAARRGSSPAARSPADAALRGGYFFAPTLFDDVAPDAALAREEVFGPVLAVTAFDSRTRRSRWRTAPTTA